LAEARLATHDLIESVKLALASWPRDRADDRPELEQVVHTVAGAISTEHLPAKLMHHNAWVNGALVMPDGRILSWSADQTLRLWDAKTEAQIGPAPRHEPKRAQAAGNGRTPVTASTHPGCCKAAPRCPHAVQRRFCRRTSLEASGPHLITKGASASGAEWRQGSPAGDNPSQQAQNHFAEPAWSSPKVGTGPAGSGLRLGGLSSRAIFRRRLGTSMGGGTSAGTTKWFPAGNQEFVPPNLRWNSRALLLVG
jgi:hypothetical protein